MNELTRLAFPLSIKLFQSILFVRFTSSCLGFQPNIRHKPLVATLAAGVLLALLAAAELLPVFKGFPIFSGTLLLLLFSLAFLEGSLGRKIAVCVLPGILAAAGNMICRGILLLLVPGADADILTALLANGILYILYRNTRAAFLCKPAQIGDAEWPALYAQLGFSTVLFLLLYYGEYFCQSRTAKLLLCAGASGLVLWNFAAYRLLAAMHKKNRAELEGRLLKQEKSNQLRVDELKYQYETLQKAKHDFKNTLSVLKSLNAERKPAQIDAYIDAYLDTAHTSATFISSENEYANAIINAKAQEARGHGIDVKIVITSPIHTACHVDICNVLGNLFDNAIAACLKIKENRRISLSIYDQGEETVFCIKNTVAHSVLEYNPDLVTDKEDKANHGYGTRIIREIAAKHKGFADFYEEGNEFCCNVVMYL